MGVRIPVFLTEPLTVEHKKKGFQYYDRKIETEKSAVLMLISRADEKDAARDQGGQLKDEIENGREDDPMLGPVQVVQSQHTHHRDKGRNTEFRKSKEEQQGGRGGCAF